MTFDLAYWAKARNTSPFYRCNFENYVSDVDAINSATNVIMKFSGYATKVGTVPTSRKRQRFYQRCSSFHNAKYLLNLIRYSNDIVVVRHYIVTYLPILVP